MLDGWSEYVFFDGERVARKDYQSEAVSYYFSDHLKTASVITNSAGTITEDEDYYPWGGELQFVNSDSNHYKFTGKLRDGTAATETGLDYFGARYYANWTGRFVTPDWGSNPSPIPYSNIEDPQSLNRYSYVRNIPTASTDPDGHRCTQDKDGNIHCVVRAKADPPPQGTPYKVLHPQQLTNLIPSREVPCEVDCNRAIVNNALQTLGNLFSLGSLENALGSMPSQQPMNTNAPPINIVPTKLAQLLDLLTVIDVSGSAPVGQKGGDVFKNDGRNNGQVLPPTDGSGNSVTYREWDVNPKSATGGRGTERIVTGSDGSAYYTNDHYLTFTKIR
jgi:RHS repeat-associated protein